MASAASARPGRSPVCTRPRELHQRARCALNGEFVRCAYKGKVGEAADLRSGGFPEAGRTVDTCAERGTAEGELGLAAPLDPFMIVGQHRRIARPFPAKSERRRILHVRAAILFRGVI